MRVDLSNVIEIAMGNSLRDESESKAKAGYEKHTFISAISWNSLSKVYIVNLLERYLSRRYAKLFVGPSAMTLNTYSKSMKYSRMSGISNAGFPSADGSYTW